jgi:hypothetical protein
MERELACVGRMLVLAAGLAVLAAGCAAPKRVPDKPAPVAAKKAPGPFAACRDGAPTDETMIDETKRRLHQTVCGAALWFDGLFGGKGDLTAARNSHGRVEITTDYSEFYGSDTRVRFNARVRLPTLEERLSVFVGRDDEDDFVRDRSEGQALRSTTRRPNERDQFLAGLGFTTVTTEQFQSDFRVGARNIRLPKVFVQNRFSYIPFSEEDSRVYLRLTPFWSNRDGFGVTPAAAWDKVLAADLLLRWDNIGTFSEKTEGFDWRSALILYQNLHHKKALAYEGFVRGAAEAAVSLAEYGTRMIYRMPVYSEKLNLEASLGYSWPREDPTLPRHGAFAVGIGLEMPFGHVPD